MNINYKIILAFGLGIIARIITNPWILGYHNENFSIHKNKIYDAIFFGCITGLIQIIININKLTNSEKILWLTFNLSIFFIISYIINNQKYIDERELLLKLRENNAESLEFCKIQLANNTSLNAETKDFLNNHIKIKIETIDKINLLLK
jgi:hypothetical protein